MNGRISLGTLFLLNGLRAAAFALLCVSSVAGEIPQVKLENPQAGSVVRQAMGDLISIDGDTMVVGAAGCAVVYFRGDGGQWVRQGELQTPDGEADGFFACSVSVSGDTVAIGAPQKQTPGDHGAAYVFTRSGATWSLQQRLTASAVAQKDDFGYSVALSSNTLVVGAINACGPVTGAGSAYVFEREDTTWTQKAELTGSDPNADFFGISISVSGDTTIIGATGAAYVFRGSGATWTEQAKLTAPDSARFFGFGDSVSISGNIAIVGEDSRSCGGLSVARHMPMPETAPCGDNWHS